MRTKLWLVAGAALSLVVAATVVSHASNPSASHRSKTVHVVEHAATDVVIDTGAARDTAGDLLTFHNAVFDASNSSRVGRDQGSCIRIDPSAGSWQCTWSTFLAGGQITVEGPFYDTKDSDLVITGGTGCYRTAGGTMRLEHRADPAEFDFVFHVTR